MAAELSPEPRTFCSRQHWQTGDRRGRISGRNRSGFRWISDALWMILIDLYMNWPPQTCWIKLIECWKPRSFQLKLHKMLKMSLKFTHISHSKDAKKVPQWLPQWLTGSPAMLHQLTTVSFPSLFWDDGNVAERPNPTNCDENREICDEIWDKWDKLPGDIL